MNAQISSTVNHIFFQVPCNFTPINSVSSKTAVIKKVDVLHYYRDTHQPYLNLGSLIISQNDGWLYFFNYKGELVGIDRIKT